MGNKAGINYPQQENQEIEKINYNNTNNIAQNFILSETYQGYGKTLTEVLKESINSDYDITNVKRMSYTPSVKNCNNIDKKYCTNQSMSQSNEMTKNRKDIIENDVIGDKTIKQEERSKNL